MQETKHLSLNFNTSASSSSKAKKDYIKSSPVFVKDMDSVKKPEDRVLYLLTRGLISNALSNDDNVLLVWMAFSMLFLFEFSIQYARTMDIEDVFACLTTLYFYSTGGEEENKKEFAKKQRAFVADRFFELFKNQIKQQQ
jgi:hypothetical protein